MRSKQQERRGLSLLTRLLAAIIGPLIALALVLAAGSTVLIYSLTQTTSDRILEGSLAAIAETLAIEDGQITLDLPPAAFGMLENAERDNVYYSVRQGARLLTGYPDLQSPSAKTLTIDEPTVRTQTFRGVKVRVAAVAKRVPGADEPVVVQVAETLKSRGVLRLRLGAVLGVLVATLVLGAAFLIPPAVGWGLAPIESLRRQVEGKAGAGPVDLSPLPLHDAPRELWPFVGAFNRLLDDLDRSTSSMRRFTADASHQMRTPLAALRIHLALARRHGQDQVAARSLEEVDSAALRLERLIAQLLALARSDEQGQGASLIPTDLAERARIIVAEMAPRAIQLGLDVGFELQLSDAPLAMADPALVDELLSNILDNALRYHPGGGRVVVRVRRVEGLLHLEVEDDGLGIGEADRALVFERFARLGRDQGRPGSGLGLAIVQQLARRMGASVHLADAERGSTGLLVQVRFIPIRD
ncbi:MAG: sensor histidine kinase [Caulobacter sp.]